MISRFIYLANAFLAIAACDMPATNEYLRAKSPMESQFNLESTQMNFPGLYDDVFAGIEGRIAGGQSGSAEDFPHQVLMYMRDENGNLFICGGSLIAYNWILTAAHCLYQFPEILVNLGVTNRIRGHAVWSRNITNLNHLIIHPKYKPNGHTNDIGLVYLSKITPDILENPNVGIIALPTREDKEINLVGVVVTVTGFGSTSDANQPSDYLRFIKMPIITNLQCQKTFGSFIRPTNLCMSGSGGRSVCSGDSGGPMTLEVTPERLVVIGIVSFGHRHGCTLGYPGVFTRVTSYLNWIEGHVGNLPKESAEFPDDYYDNASQTTKYSLVISIVLVIFVILN